MSKYLMLGKYSEEGVKGIAEARTGKVISAIEKSGGKIISMHVLLGVFDLALLVEFPGSPEVMKASVAISKLTGIHFTTSPALTVEEFDRIMK